MKHNDIIVLATDGVTDNLFDEQIINDCISPQLERTGDLLDLDEVALCIATLAEAKSLD